MDSGAQPLGRTVGWSVVETREGVAVLLGFFWSLNFLICF